jgi:hypothetical protein
VVEGLLDGHQHEEGGHRQQPHAEPGQLPRLHGERAQVLLHRLAGGGHEVAEDKALDILADVLKGRNGGEHGEGHGHHRHHREQRGVGQRRGAAGTAILDETPRQGQPELQPILHAMVHALSLANHSQPTRLE